MTAAKNNVRTMTGLHPAAEWAENTRFSSSDVDCTTTVVLKILDNKCKMLPGEKDAIIEIYHVVKQLACKAFTESDHKFISEICSIIQQEKQLPKIVAKKIHELRLYAEAHIPKPVMKTYKAMLREGLFG